MLAVWGGGAFEERLPHFIRQGDVLGGCINNPQGMKRHSPHKQSTGRPALGQIQSPLGREQKRTW